MKVKISDEDIEKETIILYKKHERDELTMAIRKFNNDELGNVSGGGMTVEIVDGTGENKGKSFVTFKWDPYSKDHIPVYSFLSKDPECRKILKESGFIPYLIRENELDNVTFEISRKSADTYREIERRRNQEKENRCTELDERIKWLPNYY